MPKPKSQQKPRKLKVAVIGLQWVGQRHIEGWLKQNAEIVALADVDDELRDKVCKQYDFDPKIAFATDEQALGRTDAEVVSLCIPTGLHEQVVGRWLRAGRDVLCEKPPANNADEAARMAEVAADTGRTLAYSLQRRFLPEVQAARQAIDRGRVGEIYYGRTGWVRRLPAGGFRTPWRYDRTRGGGATGDLGVHMLDIAWFAIGCPRPLSVSAMTSCRIVPQLCKVSGHETPKLPADDTAAALIRFDGDLTMLLESSFAMWRASGPVTYCEFAGTQGAVEIMPDPLIQTGEQPERLIPEQPETPPVGTHDLIVADFYDAVTADRPPCVTADQGVELMRLLDAIVQSADARKEIRLA